MNLKITILLIVALLNFKINAQKINLFDLQSYSKKENEVIHFVSISNVYILSEHKDSTAIPSLKGKTESNSKYLKLDSKFKKRLFSKTKITDSDKLFLYDYAKDVLLTFSIKSLNTVACLNVKGASWPYKQEDYSFGFEINDKLEALKNDFSTVLVYIGKENPFTKGEIKRIEWKKITAKNLPTVVTKEKKIAELNQFIKNNKSKLSQLFEYKINDYSCFLHEYNDAKGKAVTAKYLVIVNDINKKVVLQKLFIESEGVTFAPITNQWIGKLLTNSVPVIFGFQNFSSGSTEIIFIEQSDKSIVVNCDNRH